MNIPIKALIPIYRKLLGVSAEAAKEHKHVFTTIDYESMIGAYFAIDKVKHVAFLHVLEQRLGIGYSADDLLSAVSTRIYPLRYFATGVWIKSHKVP